MLSPICTVFLTDHLGHFIWQWISWTGCNVSKIPLLWKSANFIWSILRTIIRYILFRDTIACKYSFPLAYDRIICCIKIASRTQNIYSNYQLINFLIVLCEQKSSYSLPWIFRDIMTDKCFLLVRTSRFQAKGSTMFVILVDIPNQHIMSHALFRHLLTCMNRTSGFQAGPYFPNFPYFLTAALIFLIKASKS